MSRENPTTEEIDAILQHEYGAYGVELPDWYTTPNDLRYDRGGWLKAAAQVAATTRRQILTAKECEQNGTGDE